MLEIWNSLDSAQKLGIALAAFCVLGCYAVGFEQWLEDRRLDREDAQREWAADAIERARREGRIIRP